jgi:hypothetical protein
MLRIIISETDGKQTLCFDTGLDPRSFARTKLAQTFNEHGFVVCPDNSVHIWAAAGVTEHEGFMRIWGPLFDGIRLDDLLLVPGKQDMALQAVISWIQGKLALGDTSSVLSPGAAFVLFKDDAFPKGSVLFTPENLAERCLSVEGYRLNHFMSPDLSGMNAAAFCAAAMLYKIFAGVPAYPSVKDFYQDMREGFFVPLHLAAPGIDDELASCLQTALLQPVSYLKKSANDSSLLKKMLKILMKMGADAPVSAFFGKINKNEEKHLVKERERFIKRRSRIVKIKRFVKRNKVILIIAGIILIFSVFVVSTTIVSRNSRPTTKGMDPRTMVTSYYEAFSNLNHQFMEECLMGADKSDINAAINYFVIYKIRQSNELKSSSSFITARVWKENGGTLPAPDVFGVVDLSLVNLEVDDTGAQTKYRADYTLWYPNEPLPVNRSDVLTLARNKKGNWQITKIDRTINDPTEFP